MSPGGVGPGSVLFSLGWWGGGREGLRLEVGALDMGENGFGERSEDGREAMRTGHTGGRVCRSWG